MAAVVLVSTFSAFIFIMCDRRSFNDWLKDFASSRLRPSKSSTRMRRLAAVSDSWLHDAFILEPPSYLAMRGLASDCIVCIFLLASVTAPRTALATPQVSVRRWMPSETSWNIVSRPLALFLPGDLAGELPSLESLQSPRNCGLLPEEGFKPVWLGRLENSGGLPEYFEMMNLPLSAVGFCSKYIPSYTKLYGV